MSAAARTDERSMLGRSIAGMSSRARIACARQSYATRPVSFGRLGRQPAGPVPDRRVALTLIELLLVLAILSILAALVYPAFTTSTDTARIEAAASNVN